jgi:SNF2 family DNA or RNA helicase
LSLLLVLRNEAKGTASLLANWAAEIARFAPSLKAVVAHPSAMPESVPVDVGISAKPWSE